MSKFTPWFDGDVKPARRGVYQREYRNSSFGLMYCRWTGNQWMRGHFTPAGAARSRERSLVQSVAWRGLAKEPK